MPKKTLLDDLGKTKIGSFFVKTDEEDVVVSKEESAPESTPTVTNKSPNKFVPKSFSMPESSESVDPVIKSKIEQIANNAEQLSYTKFKELVSNMQSSLTDEAQCYVAALAAAKAFNFPVQEVLRGLDVILNDLNQAEQQFKNTVPGRISSKVGSRQSKIADLEKQLTAKREEITRLQESITRLNGEISKVSASIQNETAAISQDEKAIREDEEKFITAMAAVKAPYILDREKIATYGGKK